MKVTKMINIEKLHNNIKPITTDFIKQLEKKIK